MPTDVTVPDIGDFDTVPVIEIHVAVGDTISPEDPLITLESDKAAMDVPSPVAGTVKELKVNVGDDVKQGSLILRPKPRQHRRPLQHHRLRHLAEVRNLNRAARASIFRIGSTQSLVSLISRTFRTHMPPRLFVEQRES